MNEAELLFTGILNCDRLSLYLNKEMPLGIESSFFISLALKRRIKGEPIQYILGRTEFMGLEFKVNKDVFIPRPETEILVETAIKYSSLVPQLSSFVNISDIGTGSGCIAVSLAKHFPNSEITALDISDRALEIAQYNGKLHNVAERIKFIKSDLFSSYGSQITNCDIIVSNPPYIPNAEIDNLEPEIKYEPRIALDGGKDGLDFYRSIIRESPRILKKGGFLILEMGFNQRRQAENIFQESKAFEITEVKKDYNHIDRVIVGQLRADRKRYSLNAIR